MTSSSLTDSACQRYELLRQAEAESELLDPDDRQFLERHVQSCEHCRTLEAVLGTVGWDEEAVPCESLDELSRRRLVNDAVTMVDNSVVDDSTELQPEALPTTAPASVGRFRRRFAYAAAATALLVAGALLWSPWQRSPDHRLTLTPAATPAPSARYLLLAGQVRSPAGRATLGQTLRTGQWLETGAASRAVLRLPSGATVLLGAQTRLQLHASSTRTVTLERGVLLALVDPQQPNARFAVLTAQGRVTVKGTVFEVTADKAGSRAAVLRGQVRVSTGGGAGVSLMAGHGVALGSPHPRPLSAQQSSLLWQRVRLLDLLQTHRPATLTVTSRPVGARVLVDAVSLGTTPLAVSLRPGHRRLELAATDHAAVREHVLLKTGVHTTRDFELRATPTPSTAASAKVEAGGASAPSTKTGPTPAPGKIRSTGPRTKDLRRALLNRAQLLRTARDWRNAARAYAELIRRYSRSAEATTALVSLGVLQLRHLGQPRQALKSFDSYLRRSRRGALAREAAYGRIQALRALGQRGAEIRALRRFLLRYPRSLRAARVKRRLTKLTRSTGAQNPGMSKP